MFVNVTLRQFDLGRVLRKIRRAEIVYRESLEMKIVDYHDTICTSRVCEVT